MKIKTLFTLMLSGLTSTLFAQALVADTTFNPGTGAEGTPEGGNVKYVYVNRQLSDGKIIVGGQFTQFNGQPANQLVRLNADGTTDTSFAAEPAPWLVGSIAEDEDGKIVFGAMNSVVKRLNTDGSTDTTFNMQQMANAYGDIAFVARQGDKYIVSGVFSTFGWEAVQYHHLIRLNHDGSLDTSFAGILFDNDATFAHAYVLADDKIMVTGQFSSLNGQVASGIVRLNADGTVDTTFNTGTGAQGIVRGFAVQPDGKYIITGSFNSFNDIPRNKVARLNSDGSVDDSFVPPTGDTVMGFTVGIEADGKIIVGGNFYDSYIDFENDDSVTRYLQRFNTDGSLYEYQTGINMGNQIIDLQVQADGKILIGGWFESYDGTPVGCVMRLTEGTAGVVQNQKTPLTAYPNPFDSTLHITSTGFSANAQVSVADTTGKILYRTNGIPEKIDLASLATGVYLLHVSDGDKTAVQKIIRK